MSRDPLALDRIAGVGEVLAAASPGTFGDLAAPDARPENGQLHLELEGDTALGLAR